MPVVEGVHFLWWSWRSRITPIATVIAVAVTYHSSDASLSLQWLSCIIPLTILHHSMHCDASEGTNMNFELYIAS